MPEVDVITLRKRRVCPGCGMTIEKGGEMFRSLKLANKYVCVTCAIKERDEIKKRKAVRLNG